MGKLDGARVQQERVGQGMCSDPGGGDHDLCNGGGRGGLGYSKRRGEGMYLHQAGAP